MCRGITGWYNSGTKRSCFCGEIVQ